MSMKLFRVLFCLLFLTSPVQGATSAGTSLTDAGGAGCTNGYVRWVHTVADVTELLLNSAAYQMTGLISAHTEETSSSTIADCFTTASTGHAVQYTCANAYYKIRALVSAKVENASDLYVAIGVDTDHTLNASNRIDASTVIQSTVAANDYVQHVIEYDATLVEDSYYGVLVQSSAAGTDYTNATAGWLEFQEQRCDRGTP